MQEQQEKYDHPRAEWTPPQTLADRDRTNATAPNGPTPAQVHDAKQGGES